MLKTIVTGLVVLTAAPAGAKSVELATFDLTIACAKEIAKDTREWEGTFTEDSYLIRYYRACGQWENEFMDLAEKAGHRQGGADAIAKMHRTIIEGTTGHPMQRDPANLTKK